MAASAKCSKITSLILRILTSVLHVLALLILATNTTTIKGDYGSTKLRFSDFYAYRYVMAATVIGLVLSLLQIALSIYSIATKTEGTMLFDFFSDKLLSYLIITGSVAGVAVTVDLKANLDDGGILDTYFAKAFASSVMLLLAFFCTAVASILSSFALTKQA